MTCEKVYCKFLLWRFAAEVHSCIQGNLYTATLYCVKQVFFRLINLQSRKKIKVPFTPVTIAIEVSAWDYVIK